jgi:C1A family cysteine protease
MTAPSLTRKTLISLFTLATLSAIASTTPANASERWRFEVDKRQAKHSQLIREGRRYGTLTFWEARRLRREQSRIAQLQRLYMADGYLDPSEKRALRYAQDSAAKHIFAQRNNSKVGWWRRGYWN